MAWGYVIYENEDKNYLLLLINCIALIKILRGYSSAGEDCGSKLQKV